MKINKNILSIPPYISTSWDKIDSIYQNNNLLVIVLLNGTRVQIPDLNENIVKLIFDSHYKYMESKNAPKTSINFAMPEMNGSLESLSTAMQHNPSQKDLPLLPDEILKKIATVAKIFSDESHIDLPKAEPNCNCMHCQIARAIQFSKGENIDDEVSEEDLKFRTWDIEEEGQNLYKVVNPLDKNEHYSVYLGEPLGCTCGKKNCEHIKAVLTN